MSRVLPFAIDLRLKPGAWRVTDRAAWHVLAQPTLHMVEVSGIGDRSGVPFFLSNDCGGTADVLLFEGGVVLADTSLRRVRRLSELTNAEEYVRWRVESRQYVSQPAFIVDFSSGLVTEEMISGRRLVSRRSRHRVTTRLLNDVDRWTSRRLRNDTALFHKTKLFAWYLEHSDQFDRSTRNVFESLGEEPSLVSHGDLSPWNIIVTDDAPGYCVIDWDESPTGGLPAWFDLATAAITSGNTEEFQQFLLTRPWIRPRRTRGLMEAWSAVVVVKRSESSWRKSGGRFTLSAQHWSDWAASYVNRTRDVA